MSEAGRELIEIDTVDGVVKALFGEGRGAKARFMAWYGCSEQLVYKFTRRGWLPSHSYVVISRELARVGCRPVPRLFGMSDRPEIAR